MQHKTVLFIGFTWPEPTSTAAGSRMLQLLQVFGVRKYRRVFTSAAAESPLSLDLESFGVEKRVIKLNDTGFDTFISDLKPDIVVFDRFLTEEQFGWRVAEFAPQALRILDTEDLHSLRTSRQAVLKKGIPFTTEAWLQSDTAKREIASIYRCDLSLIISAYEMQLLTEVLKIDDNLLLHLPFMLDAVGEKTLAAWLSFEERRDFVCIGNGKHAPNVDAILWLKKEIWPLIRKQLPDVNLLVYGAYLPQHIQQMDNPKEGFRVRGWAEDAIAVLQKARISLAPLRFGAGIKGKLIDAMQAGTPSITTDVGAEGMCGGLPWNGKIANSAEDFSAAAVRLYRDALSWHRAQRYGISLVNSFYDKGRLSEKLIATIEKIGENQEHHRNQNFIGSMLQHHTMTSTKYLARWIEIKNQDRH
ncbi:glycosyltransferase [Pricia sp. S334]|uniref:Glycosyltransferase n=1 Tax=Pricia mediterranea TaxID=3076079 RepID=A0ABU3LAK1_9FLAO|nr:glycosyltransferase [Pricia sp. S334]MDT7830707.1 glycosyltransferase [Pricia sp. S334]